MKPILALALSLFFVSPLVAAEFRSDWQGSRPWVGPEYWAGPLYDWKTEDGAVIAVAAKDRLLHLLSHRPLDPQKGFQMQVTVELLSAGKVASPAAVWAGMAVGVKGMMEDPRHVAVWPKQRIEAVVRVFGADGKVLVNRSQSATSGELHTLDEYVQNPDLYRNGIGIAAKKLGMELAGGL